MNRSLCACHKVALRLFVRSLAGPLARQPSAPAPAAAHLFADQKTDAGQGPMRTVRARTTASYSIARFHTARPRFSAQVATASVMPAAEPATEPTTGPTGATDSTDTRTTAFPVPEPPTPDWQSSSNPLATTETTQGSPSALTAAKSEASTSEVQGAAQDAAPRVPGKNRRKKLRRQREAEAAAAAAAAEAADARDTPGETEGTAGTGLGVSTSIADAEKSTGASTAAEEAVAASVTGTAMKKENSMERSMRPPEAKTDQIAKTEKGTKITKKARERKESQKNTATKTKVVEKKERKEKKQKSESAARPAVRAIAPSPSTTAAEPWQIQKRALQEKFQGEAWNPRKKLSPDAIEGIRALHTQMPDVYTTPVLAKHFAVSPEAIRRILKSKWQPSVAEEEDRQERWFERGKKVWQRWAALGKKPPKRWQAEGIRRDNPRRERQRHDRTRRQVRAAWQREEMGAMGGMGMLHGDGAGRSPVASGAAADAGGDRSAGGLSRELAPERHAKDVGHHGYDREDSSSPHTGRPRQTQSLGKRVRMARQTAHGKR